MRILWKLLTWPIWVWNYMRLRRHHVRVDMRAVTIAGLPIVTNKGQFIIHDGVRINSRYSANPIGGQTFCSFFVGKNGQLEIGRGAGISNSTIVCFEKIVIGEHVMIGGDCRIYDTDFHSLNYEKRVSPQGDTDVKTRPVIIKNGAFIGAGSIILKGSTIGDRSIVGAGSVVSANVPDLELWAGNPARFIRRIDSEA